VRAGRPRWIAAYPQLALILGFFALLALTAAGVADATAQTWLWSLTSAFSGYMWVVALIALEQRNRAMQTPFVEIVGAMHPFWGGPATPYTVAPGKLRRLAAPDDRALAICRSRRSNCWSGLCSHPCLPQPRRRRDGIAVRSPPCRPRWPRPDGNPGWSRRWLALPSTFFDLILRLTIAGHVDRLRAAGRPPCRIAGWSLNGTIVESTALLLL
jgi:hypothetical protein